MMLSNTVKHSTGELLTGKLWRKDHSFFKDLPFYSNIPRMEEMAGPLEDGLSQGAGDDWYNALLVVWESPIFINNLITSLPEVGKGSWSGSPFQWYHWSCNSSSRSREDAISEFGSSRTQECPSDLGLYLKVCNAGQIWQSSRRSRSLSRPCSDEKHLFPGLLRYRCKGEYLPLKLRDFTNRVLRS